MPKQQPTYYKKGKAAGRYFSPSEKCNLCGKGNVPCSNVADEWNCQACFEIYHDSVASDHEHIFSTGSTADNFNGKSPNDDLPPRRKGFTAKL